MMGIFFFQAEDGIRDHCVTGVQTCALPICFALRAGAAHPDPCVGQAPGETLADSAQMSIARSLLYGVANLLHPRMLWLMLWPMLIALAIWGTVAIALWVRVATLIASVLQRWLETAMFFANFNLGDATLVAAHVLLFLVFVPLVYLTALFILGVFGMQAMVDHVARRSFPDLERR